jgi:cell division transport system ATP-binding protein
VGEPAIILADEPTGNLDPLLATDILGLLEDIHETGATVIFATHDRTLLDVRPRRVVVLDEGKAVDVPHGLGVQQALDEGAEIEERGQAPEPDDFAEDGAVQATPTEKLVAA